MKNTLIGIIALSLGLAFAAPQAQARDDGWAAFGGLIGGAILAHAVFQGSSHGSHHGYSVHGYSHSSKGGRYEYRQQRVWVPGHYDYERDACGHKVRVFHPGHHKIELVKVWVPYSHGHVSRRRSCDF